MHIKKLTVVTLITAGLLCQIPIAQAARKTTPGEYRQSKKIVSLLNKARKHSNKGKMQDSIDTYWKVLELDSGEPYAYLELGEIYKNLRIYDRSIEMLNSGLNLAENVLDAETLSNYYCILTEVYYITGQQGLANKSLIKATELDPKSPMPRKVLGDIYLKNARVSNAVKAYKKALELDPYFQPALEALGKIATENPSVTIDNSPKREAKRESKPQAQKKANYAASIASDNSSNLETESMPQQKPIKKAKLEERPKPIPNTTSSTTENDREGATPPIPSKEEDERQLEIYIAGNFEQKEKALDYFLAQGKKGLSQIEELIYDPDPEVRILATKALTHFVQYKKEVVAILEDASDDSDPEVVKEIESALKLIK